MRFIVIGDQKDAIASSSLEDEASAVEEDASSVLGLFSAINPPLLTKTQNKIRNSCCFVFCEEAFCFTNWFQGCWVFFINIIRY